MPHGKVTVSHRGEPWTCQHQQLPLSQPHAVNRSQRKCICKQGLPEPSPAGTAVQPALYLLLSQVKKCWFTRHMIVFFKSFFLWSKENKPDRVTLCGRRIVLFYPPRVLTLHPTHHVKLSCWGELCQARIACVENRTLM